MRTTRKSKRWHVSILRKRAEHLGVVEAPDERTAVAVAVQRFRVTGERKRRLAVREESNEKAPRMAGPFHIGTKGVVPER